MQVFEQMFEEIHGQQLVHYSSTSTPSTAVPRNDVGTGKMGVRSGRKRCRAWEKSRR